LGGSCLSCEIDQVLTNNAVYPRQPTALTVSRFILT